MKRFHKNNGAKTFCRLTQEQLEHVQFVLCALDDSVALCDDEREALGTAIQIVGHIANAIRSGEKLHLD